MDRREDKLASADQGLRHLVAVATRAPYSWYVAGQAADTIGLWMQRLALGWLVWELTGSATWLGAISFLKFAPTMLLGLFGGVLADRFPRGRIVLAAQAVTVFQAAAVALLIVTGDISLPILVVLTLMVGIAVGLSQAASKAVVSELVPRADVPAAIALNSVVFNVSQLAGPAIAGVVLVFAGNVACFVAVALLFATNLVVFWRILPHVSARPAGDGQPMLRAIGTALALLSITTNTHLLLILICGINVMEAGSVAVQMGVFKASGRTRRLFRMTPIHHHFELVGWPETTVIIRFWIICGICVAAALGIFIGDFTRVLDRL